MKKYNLLKQGKKVSAAVLSASLVLTAAVPGTTAYAAEMEVSDTAEELDEGSEAVELQEEDGFADDSIQIEEDDSDAGTEEPEEEPEVEVQEDIIDEEEPDDEVAEAEALFSDGNEGNDVEAFSASPQEVPEDATEIQTKSNTSAPYVISKGGNYTLSGNLYQQIQFKDGAGTADNPIKIYVTGDVTYINTTVDGAPIFSIYGDIYLEIIGVGENAVTINDQEATNFIIFQQSDKEVNLKAENLIFNGSGKAPNQVNIARHKGKKTISFTDMTFQNFNSETGGFAVSLLSEGGLLNASLTRCTFKDNSGISGGGLSVKGNEKNRAIVNLTDCVFDTNTNNESGYAEGNGAGSVNVREYVDFSMTGGSVKNGAITGTMENNLATAGGIAVAANATCLLDNVEISGNGGYGVYNAGTLILKGNTTIGNNTLGNLYLSKDQKLNIAEGWNGTAGVTVANRPTENNPIQITTAGSHQSGKILSDDSSLGIGNTDGSLYLYAHQHDWSYNANEAVITASCKSTNPNTCNYYSEGLKATLNVEESVPYSGQAYTGATVTDNITPVTGAAPGAITYYLNDGTTPTNDSNSGAADNGAAPVNAGMYTAKVTIGGATASADFEITKAAISPVLTFGNLTYGQKENLPTPAVSNPGGGTVTYAYKVKGAEDRTYTEGSVDDLYKLPAGEYTLRANVSETTNYEAGSASCDFSIAKASKAAPKVSFNPETIKRQHNGQLTNVTSAMEYRKEGETQYRSIDGDTVTNLEPGTYYVRYKEDSNYEVSADVEVTIGVGRSLVLTLPEKDEQIGYTITVTEGDLTWNGYAKLHLTLADGYSKTNEFAVLVNGQKVSLDKDGFYTINGMQADTTVEVSGVVDITAPTGTIKAGTNTWDSFVNDAGFNTYANTKQDVTIAAEDHGSGMQGIFYYLSDKMMTKGEVEALNDKDWNKYKGTFSLNQDGRYIVYAKMTDKAGNVEYLSSDGMILDATPATITGVTSNGVYTGSTAFTVTDQYLDKVLVDGREVTPDENGSVTLVPKSGTYRIEATDKAGNVATIDNVTVNWQEVNAPTVNSKIYTGETLTADISNTAEYEIVENKGGINVGGYNVVLKLADTVNYKWQNEQAGQAQTTIRFEITKADPKVTAPTAIRPAYNGAEQTLVNKGTIIGGTLEYSLDGTNWAEKLPSAKNAGNYTVYYRVKEDPNFNAANGGEVSAVIEKKTVTVVPKDASKVYGEADPKLTYEAKDVAAGETLAGITVKRASGEDAAEYEITASAEETANPNYRITFKSGTFTIVKAAAIGVLTKEPEVKNNVTYNGSDQQLVTAGEATNGTLMYQVNGGEWTDKIPTAKNAGTYKVSYKIKGDGNHEDSVVKDLTVTVTPKVVTVTANNAKKSFGKADPKLTYKVSGLVGNDKLSDIVISRKAGEKAGSYAITVSQKQGANPNYTITFKNAVFTITQGNQSGLSGDAISKLKLPTFLARGTGANKKVNLKWMKYSGATGYEVYWSYCDGNRSCRKLATVTNGKLTATHKKLKNNREYKYFVAAYKMVDGKKVYIAKSNGFHVAMKQANTTNAKSVSVKKKNVVLRKGKTFQIKASVKLENKKKKLLSHTAKFRYYVVDSKVATVSKRGKIKAVGKGTTYVYVLANNGAFKTVKVTVK